VFENWGYVKTSWGDRVRTASANSYIRTDYEDVGAIEAHGAVLLDDGQGHEAHVRGFGPEGRQLFAQNVPAPGKRGNGKRGKEDGE
jgi:hypothetical protein